MSQQCLGGNVKFGQTTEQRTHSREGKENKSKEMAQKMYLGTKSKEVQGIRLYSLGNIWNWPEGLDHYVIQLGATGTQKLFSCGTLPDSARQEYLLDNDFQIDSML